VEKIPQNFQKFKGEVFDSNIGNFETYDFELMPFYAVMQAYHFPLAMFEDYNAVLICPICGKTNTSLDYCEDCGNDLIKGMFKKQASNGCCYN
jgi:hypothetical protein